MDLNRKIRFGVLVDSDILEWWQRDTIKLLIDNGIEHVLTTQDIDLDTASTLDFILSFKFQNPSVEILKGPKYGVWKLVFNALCEFMDKIPNSKVILQQLSCNNDKCLILKSLQLDTILHSYKAHRDRLYKEAKILPLQACKDLIINGKLEPEDIQNSQVKPLKYNALRYYWLRIWRRFIFHFNYFFRQEDWNVGCRIDNAPIKWLKPRKSEYFADPFVITTNDDTYIFFEWFSNKNGKADLAIAKKSENFEIYHKITDFPEHRSYPFVLEYQGVIYCIPEAHKTNKISLYRFENDSLIFDCDLVEGCYVDSTLYHHTDGKWYLFTTPREESHTHLLIFVADDLRGPYTPHFNNPVKVDCRCSRMAGKIQNIDGDLVRPGQNSTHHYGESITLNKIIELNEYQYIEKEVKEIKPDKKWRYNKGIHTINSDGGITVFDAKKFTFTWQGFVQQIKQKLC